MSYPMVDAFAKSQGIPVELSEVEQTLEQLWGPAAEKAGGPELDHPSVTRVVLANVVLVRLGPDRPGLAETIAAITTQYPSRLILVRSDRSGGRNLSAEVSAQCHLPAPGRPQVCSEQIILKSSPEGLDLLPGAVRSLVESDLHSVLWWCDDPRSAPDLFEALSDEATRVILDLPDPDSDPAALAAAADADRRMLTKDVVWFGLTPWKGMIADAIDRLGVRGFPKITELRVRSVADSTDRLPRAAAWLASWFAGQLGWEPAEGPRASPGGVFEASMKSGNRDVSIGFRVERGEAGPLARIAEVEIGLEPIGEAPRTLGLRCNGDGTCEVRITDDRGAELGTSTLIRATSYDTARRVSAAFLTDRADPSYRRALPIALWLLGAKPIT